MKSAIAALRAKAIAEGQVEPAPASAHNLKRAEAAGFPKELLDFYRQCEPEGCLEFRQRIWSIDAAITENTGAVPGCALSPHGYIVFASTRCGDAYCIDTTVKKSDGCHPIALFSHEVADEDTPLEVIQRLRVEVAGSLEEFLRMFTDETLSEDACYG